MASGAPDWRRLLAWVMDTNQGDKQALTMRSPLYPPVPTAEEMSSLTPESSPE